MHKFSAGIFVCIGVESAAGVWCFYTMPSVFPTYTSCSCNDRKYSLSEWEYSPNTHSKILNKRFCAGLFTIIIILKLNKQMETNEKEKQIRHRNNVYIYFTNTNISFTTCWLTASIQNRYYNLCVGFWTHFGYNVSVVFWAVVCITFHTAKACTAFLIICNSC